MGAEEQGSGGAGESVDCGLLMMDDALRELMRSAEGKTFQFTFKDGMEMSAKVVSATHVGADGTIVLLRVGASPKENAWQVSLDEIASAHGPVTYPL